MSLRARRTRGRTAPVSDADACVWRDDNWRDDNLLLVLRALALLSSTRPLPLPVSTAPVAAEPRLIPSTRRGLRSAITTVLVDDDMRRAVLRVSLNSLPPCEQPNLPRSCSVGVQRAAAAARHISPSTTPVAFPMPIISSLHSYGPAPSLQGACARMARAGQQQSRRRCWVKAGPAALTAPKSRAWGQFERIHRSMPSPFSQSPRRARGVPRHSSLGQGFAARSRTQVGCVHITRYPVAHPPSHRSGYTFLHCVIRARVRRF